MKISEEKLHSKIKKNLNLPIPRLGTNLANSSLYLGCENANTNGFIQLPVFAKKLVLT